MPTATYRFVRGSTTKAGNLSAFLSQNRASTDALNALNKWASDAANRSFETVDDSDELLVARLTWDESDIEAGPSLERHCEHVGVNRQFVAQN